MSPTFSPSTAFQRVWFRTTSLLTNDGAFEILLDRPCYVHFDQLVHYEKGIRGKLSYGSVTGVSGIQAKKLFIWVSVTGMKAEPGSDWLGLCRRSFPPSNSIKYPSARATPA